MRSNLQKKEFDWFYGFGELGVRNMIDNMLGLWWWSRKLRDYIFI